MTKMERLIEAATMALDRVYESRPALVHLMPRFTSDLGFFFKQIVAG
jgi:hypothetical protein